ncbi:MAG TPA: FG-GAP-like repeat-containing protein [Gemmataceae bacterium]|nr:FG-GAP-like repeat-containing protein [Gemmataceae bacterium]
MNETQCPRGSRFWLWSGGALVLVAAAGFFAVQGCSRNGGADVAPPSVTPVATPHLEERIQRFCGSCHENTPPDVMPSSAWKSLIERMYELFNKSGRPLHPPPIEEVVKYFEERAPLELPLTDIRTAGYPFPVRFSRTDYPAFEGPPPGSPPHISNVNLVHLFDPKKLDILACEMKNGAVLVLQPYLPQPKWRLLYGPGPDSGFNPGHTEVVDLDKDGIPDILVANLGNFLPTDRRCGSVIWLRGLGEGRFEPITLLKNKGRIADVQAADFNGDGKLDLLVASFGWESIGEIYYLENHTTDWKKPDFTVKLLDDRHGTIHVPIADLNGDGKPDFIALISQEHETIVAFVNDGKGNFEKRTLYKAPHPGYGSSGIQLVDLNGDGKLDVLYTNGDVLDGPFLLKPYHGVQWLENKGNLTFQHHPLTPMYGVHRAVAGDLDGDGDNDIVAVSFLPPEHFPQRAEKKIDAIIVLEQTAPGVFVRHSLEKENCDYVSCALGDVFSSGKLDLVTGSFSFDGSKHAISIWQNLGTASKDK